MTDRIRFRLTSERSGGEVAVVDIAVRNEAGAGAEAATIFSSADAMYLTIAHFTGDGDRLNEEYGKHAGVMSSVGRDHGLILHAGAQTEHGYLIVNLWPSKERSEAAAADPRRLAVVERIGIGPDQVRREHYEVRLDRPW